jgi:acyl-CoA thioester hydrolase
VNNPQTVEIRVRYAETDRMGVVYHANYLVWCEIGRTDFIRERCGMSYADMERSGYQLAVADASIRYHAPARYDDRVLVHTTLTEVRSRTVTFEYLVTHADTGDRLVSARTTLVSIDPNGRTVAMPADIRAMLEKGMARDGGTRAAAVRLRERRSGKSGRALE